MRVSVPVPDEVAEAPAHPELVGLPRGASAAQVYARLLAVGWRHLLDEEREREELVAYAAYAHDPDARESILALQREAFKGGAY